MGGWAGEPACSSRARSRQPELEALPFASRLPGVRSKIRLAMDRTFHPGLAGPRPRQSPGSGRIGLRCIAARGRASPLSPSGRMTGEVRLRSHSPATDGARPVERAIAVGNSFDRRGRDS